MPKTQRHPTHELAYIYQFLQLRHCQCPRKPHGKMHLIAHPADAIALTAGISGRGRENTMTTSGIL